MRARDLAQLAQAVAVIAAIGNSRINKLAFSLDDQEIFTSGIDFPFGQHAQFQKLDELAGEAVSGRWDQRTVCSVAEQPRTLYAGTDYSFTDLFRVLCSQSR